MPAKKKNKHEMNCPVCGMKVDENSEFKAGHGGETFFFCSDEDKKAFQQNPSQYLNKQEKAA